ncbi:Sodium-driven chloride bicarbonate [Brachionus plicatilis]|uniref:Anion exchange protein n=1 Tax=Brachionus plicatilis TaxID=10195 RepID=A0A3M7S4C9_BRAPC|nr:Sodium-driven chloride bicarbonate [Brachionus plicatilis]
MKSYPLFCQLSELHTNRENELVWKESARWIKFVEVVEDSGRWSKPHVATISILSIIDLKNILSNGLVYLNLKSKPFKYFVDELVENMVKENMLNDDNVMEMKKILFLPHYQQYQKDFDDQLIVGETLKISKKKNKSEEILEKNDLINNGDENKFVFEDEFESTVEADDDEAYSIDFRSVDNFPIFDFKNKHFFKKIPDGSKTANILIGQVDFLKHEIGVFVKFSEPSSFYNITEVPVSTKYFFLLLGPKGSMYKYHRAGFSLATMLSDELFQNDLHEAQDRKDVITAVDDFLEQSTVIPPGQWDTSIRLEPPDRTPSKEERLILRMIKVKKDKPHFGGHEDDPCLKRTGRFCGGLIDDIKRKKRWYLSDFKDAFSFQCFPAIAFLYFACLAPIITFGGLLGFATDNYMGTIESLLSGLICGVLFSLFAGQPMTILGSTGPVLIFETILNTFSKSYGIDYIGFRCWIGLWISLFLILISITDLSFLVKYITRFTEELFAMLIAFIFVIESVDKLLKIRKSHRFTSNPYLYANEFNENSTSCFRCLHVNSTFDPNIFILNESVYTEKQCEHFGKGYIFQRECQHIPDVFFFSVILYLLTFLMVISFRYLKFSSFFSSTFRTILSNFSVVITILIMVFFDNIIGLDTPKLHVPSEFHPTIPDRGWFINPLERNEGKYWLVFAALPPAFLATILIFMDQHITAVIVNRKENKLKKSGGYHLDLFICAICIGINSVFGLPWFVAATVLSMNHVIALRKTSESTVPGEAPKLIGVMEQRVTGTVVFLLIGCSIFITEILSYIPMAVLYAIFMYMGVTPMGELEFFQRIQLLLMPKKHQPDLVYLRHVRLSRVHLFTIIQLICLVILFILKMNKKVSITFPLMVLALVFIRYALSYFFTEKELSYLDDILPGTGKKKKVLNVGEVNIDILEQARKGSIWRKGPNRADLTVRRNSVNMNQIVELIESKKASLLKSETN